MWKTFQHDDKLYMIKVIQDGDLNIFLTDLQNIWIQSVPKDEVLQRFQENNPLFDIKVEDAVTEVIKLINEISDNEEPVLSETNDELQLTLKSAKSEFQIQFQFDFNKGSSDVFLKEVTVPLIQTVKHLEVCQNVLSNIVQKKDRELEEYKLEKGMISREDLITEKFNETMLETIDDRSMLSVFGQSKTFWDSFTKKYGKIDVKIEDVRKDPWNHMKRKRKVYSSKTTIKRGKGINYNKSE